MSWFKFEAKAEDPAAVDLRLYDVIGSWVDDLFGFDGVTTAKTFISALAEIPENVKTIRVRINSPGGDVFGAATIANALRDQQLSKGRKVETFVDGLAASAASVVAMAGSKVTMADNALLMIHNPWTAAVGNPAELRKAAETLDGVRDAIIAAYQWHSPLDAKEIGKLMDAETWMTADEAIAHGFADAKVEGLSAAASIDPRGAARVIRVPEQYAARVSAWMKPAEEPAAAAVEPEPTVAAAVVEPEPAVAAAVVEPEPVDPGTVVEVVAAVRPEPEPVVPLADAAEILRVCAENKLSVEFSAQVVAAAPTRERLVTVVAAEVARLAKDAERVEAIRAMYTKYNLAKVGEGLAAAGVSVEVAGRILTDFKAQRDSVTIDGALPTAASKPKILSYREVYALANGGAQIKEK